MLPASVFHCESPNEFAEKDLALGLTRTPFNFKDGEDGSQVTHHLLHKVHQPGNDAICDGSSKSIRCVCIQLGVLDLIRSCCCWSHCLMSIVYLFSYLHAL
jgi:hypothetical protein